MASTPIPERRFRPCDKHMTILGYALSSEEHGPQELIQNARAAEEAGFSFAFISDHFHPWTRRQAHSPFVWAVIGGIAQATKTIRIGTGVTCPTIRMHPAIVAQAAATASLMLPGRFSLGVGTGENLNEHIVGAKWPSAHIRIEMLQEAIAIIRQLWQGGSQSHYGKYYRIENARIFSLPKIETPLLMAAAKPGAARMAGRLADGLIATSPERTLVSEFKRAGGMNKPRYGQVTMCWASTKEEGLRKAKEIWPNALVAGDASTELPLPRHFEQITDDLSADMMEKSGSITCGPSPETHIAAIQQFIDAGFDHIYLHQIGDEQLEFIDYVRTEIMPHFESSSHLRSGTKEHSETTTEEGLQ